MKIDRGIVAYSVAQALEIDSKEIIVTGAYEYNKPVLYFPKLQKSVQAVIDQNLGVLNLGNQIHIKIFDPNSSVMDYFSSIFNSESILNWIKLNGSTVYRIKLTNTPLFLTGYSDITCKDSRKMIYPVFSEYRSKVYTSLEKAQDIAEQIRFNHPALNIQVEIPELTYN